MKHHVNNKSGTVLLFNEFTAEYLNILFIFQQRCFHDIAKTKIPRFHIKGVACNISQALPMSGHHCLVVKHMLELSLQACLWCQRTEADFTLLAIMYKNGQVSLKSSIVFFRSLNACHSFRAEGSLQILEEFSGVQYACQIKKTGINHTCSASPAVHYFPRWGRPIKYHSIQKRSQSQNCTGCKAWREE